MKNITNYSNKQVTLINGKIIMPGESVLVSLSGELLEQVKSLEKLGIIVIG